MQEEKIQLPTKLVEKEEERRHVDIFNELHKRVNLPEIYENNAMKLSYK